MVKPCKGCSGELNPGPLAPEARIMPLDQAANVHLAVCCMGPNLAHGDTHRACGFQAKSTAANPVCTASTARSHQHPCLQILILTLGLSRSPHTHPRPPLTHQLTHPSPVRHGHTVHDTRHMQPGETSTFGPAHKCMHHATRQDEVSRS